MEENNQLALKECDKKAAAAASGGEEFDDKSEDEDESENPMGQIFKVKRQSHIGTGIVSGVGNVVKGFALGVTTLVAAPVVGGIQGGAKGAAKGLGVGVAAAVALPVAGVVTGCGQVIGGALNTKQAVQEIGKGTVYNEKTSTWEPKYRRLSEEYRTSQQAYEKYQAEKKKNSKRKISRPGKDGQTTTVVDTEYYDVLQVSPDASMAEIRKAYYKLARENHPDKCPDDEAAKDAFQRIGGAYQVLSNETTRAEYDAHGKKATENVEFVDPSLFFAILFGSEELTPFVGTLILGHLMVQDDGTEKIDPSLSLPDAEQNWRVAQIALNLKNLCEPAIKAQIENDSNTFKAWREKQRKLAAELCTKSFGHQMVDAIGFSYDNYASHYLGKDSFMQYALLKVKFKKTQKTMSTMMSAMSSAAHASRANKKFEKLKHKNSPDASTPEGEAPPMTAETAELMERSLQHVLQVMLQICLHDVLCTVRSAAQLYINDKAVDGRDCRLRAQTLKDLGTIFISEAKKYKEAHAEEGLDFRELMHDADIKMAQKMDERTSEAPSSGGGGGGVNSWQTPPES